MPRQRQKKRSKATSIRPIDSKKQKYSKDGWRRLTWSEYVGFPLKNADISDEESGDERVIISKDPTATNRRLDFEGVVADLETSAAQKSSEKNTATGMSKVPPLWVQQMEMRTVASEKKVREVQAKTSNRSVELPSPSTPRRNNQTKDNKENIQKGNHSGDVVMAEKEGYSYDMGCSQSSNREGTNSHAPLSAGSDTSSRLPNQADPSEPEHNTVVDSRIPSDIDAKPEVRSTVDSNSTEVGSGTHDDHISDEARIGQECIEIMVDDLVRKIDPLEPNDDDDEEAAAERTKQVGLTLKACKSHWQKHLSLPKSKFKALFEEALSNVLAICTWFKINGKTPAGSPNRVSPENSSAEDVDSPNVKENMEPKGKHHDGVVKESSPAHYKLDESSRDEQRAPRSDVVMQEISKQDKNTADEDSSQGFFSVKENEESAAFDGSGSNSSYATAKRGKRDSSDSLSRADLEENMVVGGPKTVSERSLPSNLPAKINSEHGTSTVNSGGNTRFAPTKKTNKSNNAGGSRGNVEQSEGRKNGESAADIIVIADSDDDEDASPQVNDKDSGNNSDSDILECWVASGPKTSTTSKEAGSRYSGGSVKAE